MGRSVLLLVNREKTHAADAAAEVRRLVASHGRLIDTVDADGDCPLIRRLAKEADLVVVVGGDGTLLGAARTCAAAGRPLLGVNVGKVGFLAEFDAADLAEQASALFGAGDLPLLHMATLRAEVLSPQTPEPEDAGIALNEFVLTAGPPFRMITIELSIDGQAGPRVSGDGLIVSTPLGSTAYNVSAGGPIVAPGVAATVVTPVAAHSLAFRPIVLPSESTIEVRLIDANDEEHVGTTLVVDGQIHRRVSTGDVVRVRPGAEPAPFVRNTSKGYWRTLMGKMRWAAAPRAKRSADGEAGGGSARG